jgi:uncharacterized cofD-like protein
MLIKDIRGAVNEAKAIKIYVSNIMTQPGETGGFTVSDHLKALFKHSGGSIVDHVIVNTGKVDDQLKELYKEEQSELVEIDVEQLNKMNISVIEADVIKIKNDLIRHNPEKLAAVLVKTIMEKKLFYDRKKIIEYFYLSERLKQNKNTGE